MKIILPLLLIFITINTFAQTDGYVDILYTENPPTIDGAIDSTEEWNRNWKEMIEGDPYPQFSDFSGQYSYLHDDDYLYIGVVVHDTTPYDSKSSNWLDKDWLEIVISVDTSKTGNLLFDSCLWKVYFTRLPLDSIYFSIMNNGINYSGANDFETEAGDDSLNYFIEIALPLDILMSNISDTYADYLRINVGVKDVYRSDEHQKHWGIIYSHYEPSPPAPYGSMYPIAALRPPGYLSSNTISTKLIDFRIKENQLFITNYMGEVRLYNCFGSKLMSKTIDRNEGIDLTRFSSGTYLVATQSGNFKFLIQ